MRYVGITFRGGTNPNLNNLEAWVTKKPYVQAGLYGQCTWFAWGGGSMNYMAMILALVETEVVV